MKSMILFSNDVHRDCTDLVSARPCKEEAPISQDQKLHTRGPGNSSHQAREGKVTWISSYFKRAPILSCASHHLLPCCSSLLLPLHHRALPAAQDTQRCCPSPAPEASPAEQRSLLALTSGQGCRATRANHQQDNPVSEGASSFAKAADTWVNNLGHIHHITVSNQISPVTADWTQFQYGCNLHALLRNIYIEQTNDIRFQIIMHCIH